MANLNLTNKPVAILAPVLKCLQALCNCAINRCCCSLQPCCCGCAAMDEDRNEEREEVLRVYVRRRRQEMGRLLDALRHDGAQVYVEEIRLEPLLNTISMLIVAVQDGVRIFAVQVWLADWEWDDHAN